MKNRTFDEMISHFNITVSEMQITQKQKMELLGMITAIAMKHNESVKHGHWIKNKNGFFAMDPDCWDMNCSVCGWDIFGNPDVQSYCYHCGAKMDESTE